MLPAWGGVSYYLSSPFCRNLYIRGVVVAVPNNTSQKGKHWRFKPAVRARKCHGWKLKNPAAADGASASKLQARCKARHDGRWWAFFCRFFFLQTLPIFYISFKKNGWSPSRVKTVRLQWPLYRHVVTPTNQSSRTKIGSDVGFAEYWCSVVSKGRSGCWRRGKCCMWLRGSSQTQIQTRQRLKVCSEVVFFLSFALDCKSVARTFRFPWRIEWNRIKFAEEAECMLAASSVVEILGLLTWFF